MRLSTTNVFLYDANPLSQQRNNTLELTYRGQTTGNTPTELFIDGTLNRRIVPDRSSGLLLNLTAVAFNNNGSVQTSSTTASVLTNAAGVASFVNLSGSGNLSESAFGSAAFQAQVARLGTAGVAVDNSYFLDAVAAVGNTPGFVRLQVRGVAANTINWEIAVRVIEATSLNG